MLTSLRLLPLLATLSASCRPIYDVSDGYEVRPKAESCPKLSTDCTPAESFEIKALSCVAPTTEFGGTATDPSVTLVVQPRAKVLAEMTPTENCSGKTASTFVKMICTVPADQLTSAAFATATKYQIDLAGKVLLPSSQLVSGLGKIDIGPPAMPPAVSLTMPVSIFKQSSEILPGDIPWNISIVARQTLPTSGLQIEFQTLVACPGTISLPGMAKFHWEVDTITVTPL